MITMQINYEIKLYDDYAHCFVKHHILLSHHYTKTILLTSFFLMMNLCTGYLSILVLFMDSR
jgi:hypothetical protein